MSKKRPTINDIAKLLNVTTSTVSRALNNHPKISDKTKEKVKETAKKLNYRHNTLAANLRQGTRNTIGIIVPRINRTFFADIIHGVESVINPAGYNMLICQTNESIEKETAHIKTLINNRVNGIIISISTETKASTHLKEIIDNDISLVQLDRVWQEMNSHKVINDNYNGAFNIVTHLLEQGCKRIAFFGGPKHINVYKQRYKGYSDALAKKGIKKVKSLIFENTLTRERGENATKKIIAEKKKVDAIFATSDFSALGAITVLKNKGIKIPQEIAVAGFANEPFTELISPKQSTVEQYSVEMGVKAAELLLKEINNENKNAEFETIKVKTKTIFRESTIRKDITKK